MLSKRWLSLIAVSALFVAVSAVLFTRPAAAGTGTEQYHFPNVELITQDGKRVHFYDDLIKGKIVAIDLIYTTCHYSCPLETARMVQVQKKLGDRVGKDIFFYSISIDPEHDTPEVLKDYMKKFGVGPGWTFLTGKKETIDFLSKRLGLYSDPSVNPDGHIAYLLIGNDAINQWIRGTALENPTFQARMIGEFLDNFKHYDPNEDKNAGTDGGPLQNFNLGQYLFAKNCVACHTIGQGDKIGPDLLGVTHVRTRKWLAEMIQIPDQLLDGKDPLATALLKKYTVRMPNLWVSNDQLNSLIRYMEEETAAREKESLASGNGGAKSAAGRSGPAHR